MQIALTELGFAYRRVKSDLYHARNANLFKLLDFEKNLSRNLRWLRSIFFRETFSELWGECVGYRLVPKDVTLKGEQRNCDGGVYSTRTDGSKREVDFCELRVIEDLPISFHLVMQLWIDRVGYKFEKCLTEDVYGYRLRIHGEEVNKKYPGTFKYYIKQYRDWHDGGLDRINLALKNGKCVAAMTADFTAFYHRLTPDFLLNPSYMKEIGAPKLSRDDLTLTKLVVRMLKKWAEHTPLVTTGLPVGCSVSSVIANLALASFDKQIGNIHGRIYYGRYVDDIIFAVENTGDLENKTAFLEMLTAGIKGLKVVNKGDLEYSNENLSLPHGTILGFNKSKVRLFFFQPGGGETFINALKDQIGKRTSEWRALPELPDDPDTLINNIVAITDSKGVEVDKLRRSEEVSIRRAAFAMKLSDFGDYATFLPSESWRAQRLAFLKAVELYFCTTKSYFELYAYFPRLIGLAALGISLDDKKSQDLIMTIYNKVKEAIDKALHSKIKIAGEMIARWGLDRASVVERVYASVCGGFREALAAAVKQRPVREKLYADLGSIFLGQKGMVENTLPEYDELLLSDLAWIPYKTLLFSVYDREPEEVAADLHPITDVDGLLPAEYVDVAAKILGKRDRWGDLLRSNAISGLLFPTRAIKPMELCSVLPCPYVSESGSRDLIIEYMRQMNYGVRGDDFIRLYRNRDEDIAIDWSAGANRTQSQADTVAVADKMGHSTKIYECRPRVALAYWRMKDFEWIGKLKGGCFTEAQKNFTRLMRFLNRLTRSNAKIDYIVFPELAMPWRWFMMVANELKKRKISVISGIEYLWLDKKGEVSNEAWCSLMTNGLKYPDAALIRVLKTAPAEHEGQELKNEGVSLRKTLSPGEFRAGDVIRHGSDAEAFFFSVLICSDLTDINLREKLRGRVDALFVPAWNNDVETFNALVMASAFDLHAYVILANNGEFGDVRIRAPRYERFRRDILQLNGGEYDYFVVGSLDIGSLRRAQSNCRSPRDPRYKSIPIGYKMSAGRKASVPRVEIDYRSLNLKYVKPGNGFYNVMWYDDKNEEYLDADYKVNFSEIDTRDGLLSWIANAVKNPYITKDAICELISAAEKGLGVKIDLDNG
jgi:hypothetical protein